MTALVMRLLHALPGGQTGQEKSWIVYSQRFFGSVTGSSIVLWLVGAFVAVLALAAVFPSVLTAQNPLLTSPHDSLWAPQASHWLGTDESGRDVWSRLVYGVRPSLLLGIASIVIAVTGGALLGLTAALGGKTADGLVSRLMDFLLAVPDVLMALLIITFWGAGTLPEIVALGVAGIPRFARLTRSRALVVRSSGYVEAARTQGQSEYAIVIRHILPNALGPVLPLATLGIGTNIAVAAGLSFLGFGAPPPAPEWGTMLSAGRDFLPVAWWLTAAPGIVLVLTVLSITVLGRTMMRYREGRSVL